MSARVIGLGGAAAGDDGVGLAVLDALRAASRAPPGVELMKIADPTALIELLEGVGLVVLVDAVVGAARVGQVVVLCACALEHGGARPLSSHGVDVASALALARAIHGTAALREVWIVGVGVSRVDRGAIGLSAAVAAAVPRAVDAVLACLTRRPSLVRS